MVASATPSPLREPVAAQRAEVRRDGVAEEEHDDEGGRELRRPGSVNLVEDTQVWGERVSPIARPGHAVEPLLVDDYVVEPAEDPVVGPELVAARTRLGLTVDRLAERTRIRPHVIESIEVDDFAPCGGDFYARGHLRTLARVLGIDVTPLLTAYDERYADAPINPRRVFEAELATGTHGSIRGTRGGPNWSVLIAAVMALVLVWSVARLIMDSPGDLRGAAPVLNGSAGVDNTAPQASDPGAGGPHRRRRRGAGRGPRRDREGRVHRQPHLRRDQEARGVAAGAGAVLRRVARDRDGGRAPRGPRRHGRAGPEHLHVALARHGSGPVAEANVA